jgi:NTE family protein
MEELTNTTINEIPIEENSVDENPVDANPVDENSADVSPVDENSWGLVLSGGGGKGAYQVGVWRALCELGWDTRIKAISGASVGALNAVLLSSVSEPRAEVIWKSITPLQFLDIDLPLQGDGIFSREGLTQLIQANLDLSRIKDNPVDLYADTSQLEEDGHYITRYYHLNEKNAMEIQQILLASSAIPVAYSSVTIDGRPQRDGGYTTPYPVKPLRDLGLKKILVVAMSLTDFDPRFYPDLDFTVIKPSRDIGYLLDGTLDFSAKGAQFRMELGYYDALRTLRAYESGELGDPQYAKAHAIDAETDYQQIQVEMRKQQLSQNVDEHKNKLDEILKKYGIKDLDL